MKLSRLLEHVDGKLFSATGAGGYDPDITSLHYRSQEVLPGGLFVAVPGLAADGHDYIEDAFARGAAAVLAQRKTGADERIVQVSDSRTALARTAAAFYGHPSAHLTLIGITGTNGKTTVTYLLESMLSAAGFRTGVIGTVNCRFDGQVFDSPVTTPESLDLQRMLADMRAAGITHVVMEVSSHGIDLGRVASCRFDVGAFTNLTQDHLDYHGTMAAYWACKQRFFTQHLIRGPKGERAVAVINTDNAYGRELQDKLAAGKPMPAMLTYGKSGEDHVHPSDPEIDSTGIRGTMVSPMGSIGFSSQLVGAYNLENIACAVAVGAALALSPEAVRAGIHGARVPGRLERVDDSKGRVVFVDYAHTPDALENALAALRSVARGRLICVFGCGGDRDRSKRPLMGRIAGKGCDLAVVTSDNPRTESPEAIIDGILTGVRQEMTREITDGDLSPAAGEPVYLVEPDRAAAIRKAVQAADPGDVVLIAGKGHETYQILGKEKRPFDDRRIAAGALEGTRGQGPMVKQC